MKSKTCTIEGCEKPVFGRGWCSGHYTRWRRNGDPLVLRKAVPGSGYMKPNGYRMISVGGKQVYEHRKVMEETLGRALSPHEVVHHKDHDRLNNAPENLELMTRSTHQRYHLDGKTHCNRGHPFNSENTYMWHGCRECRICRRENLRQWQRAHRVKKLLAEE